MAKLRPEMLGRKRGPNSVGFDVSGIGRAPKHDCVTTTCANERQEAKTENGQHETESPSPTAWVSAPTVGADKLRVLVVNHGRAPPAADAPGPSRKRRQNAHGVLVSRFQGKTGPWLKGAVPMPPKKPAILDGANERDKLSAERRLSCPTWKTRKLNPLFP